MKMLVAMRWVLVLVASLLFASPVFAGNTAEIGGQTGSIYNQECGGESLLIGFDYTSGKALDSLGAICGIRANGDWTGEIVHKGRAGGGGGNGPFTVQSGLQRRRGYPGLCRQAQFHTAPGHRLLPRSRSRAHVSGHEQ